VYVGVLILSRWWGEAWWFWLRSKCSWCSRAYLTPKETKTGITVKRKQTFTKVEKTTNINKTRKAHKHDGGESMERAGIVVAR
jgi:hypothetical protein